MRSRRPPFVDPDRRHPPNASRERGRPAGWRHDPAKISPTYASGDPSLSIDPALDTGHHSGRSLDPSLWLHDPANRVAAWGCKLAGSAENERDSGTS